LLLIQIAQILIVGLLQKLMIIVEFIKSQNPKNVSLEDVIDFIKKNFATEKKWEQLMRDYWEKVKLFT
jgi:hypothetical protein